MHHAPAEQGLHTFGPHVLEVEVGLGEENEEELPVAQGGVQFVLQVEPVHHGRVHLGTEDHEPVLARSLGLVQGYVGVTQQVAGRGPRPVATPNLA